MLRAVPPVITPTLALDSSSIRPSRMSAIARAAARIADRPSSGYIPACDGASVEPRRDRLRVRRAEDDLADRRRLVVDVAELAPRAGSGRTRTAPSSPTSSFGVKSSSTPACGTVLGDDPPRRLEHHGDRRLVVGAEDRARRRCGRCRPRRPPARSARRRHGVEMGAEEDRRSLAARVRAGGRGCSPSSSRRRLRRRPRPRRARCRRARRAPGRRPPAPRPGGLGIAQSSRNRLENVAQRWTASTATARRVPAPARALRRRTRGRAAPAASGAT